MLQSCNWGLSEADAIGEGCDKSDDGGDLGEGEEWGRIVNLLVSLMEQIIDDGEEEGEEDCVGEIEREWESVRGLSESWSTAHFIRHRRWNS